MRLALFLIAVQQPDPAGPESVDRLSRLLKAAEAPPANEWGELLSDWRQTAGPRPADSSPHLFKYRYAIHGDKMLVAQTWTEGNAGEVNTVYVRNDRLEFQLQKFGTVWALMSHGPTFGYITRLNEHFWSHFRDVHALHGQNLGDLITDPRYAVTLERTGPRDVRVSGKVRDNRDRGLLEFRADVRRSPTGAYAYIQSSESTKVEASPTSATGRRDQVTVRLTVKEDPQRPRLVAAKTTRTATMDGVAYRYEEDVRVTSHPGLSPEQLNEFELAHYGVAEPQPLDHLSEQLSLIGPEPPPEPDAGLVWPGLAGLAVILLLVVYRYLGGFRRRPLRQAPAGGPDRNADDAKRGPVGRGARPAARNNPTPSPDRPGIGS